MWLKTIEQERAEAESAVKDMSVVGSVRRLERSQWVYAWDDTDMDTTETLYKDMVGAYHLRIEEYHDFMDSDRVWDISRKEAQEWIRKNVRASFRPRQRKRMMERALGV